MTRSRTLFASVSSSVSAIFVISAMLNGLALSYMWKWFAVSTFKLPSITIVQAIGISALVSFLTSEQVNCQPRNLDTNEELINEAVRMIVLPLKVLLFGWIVHLFL